MFSVFFRKRFWTGEVEEDDSSFSKKHFENRDTGKSSATLTSLDSEKQMDDRSDRRRENVTSAKISNASKKVVPTLGKLASEDEEEEGEDFRNVNGELPKTPRFDAFETLPNGYQQAEPLRSSL